MKKLSGKIALVTGGARGIGAGIARAFADDGADVIISYSASVDHANTLVDELKSKGVKAAALKADQADAKQVRQLINDVIAKFGGIDILVNNAGVYVPGAIDDENRNEADFARQYAINVHGVVTAVSAAAPHMKTGGRIITIGSSLGDKVPFANAADYSATKAAVANYGAGWARDLGAKGITVNTVQPGPIHTDMNSEEGDFAAILKPMTALGRYGKVEEVAAAVAFLASPAASYITGTTLTVDGGFNA